MHNLPRLPCFLNGDYTDLPEAKVSVMDRGFIFGDGVYEAVPVYGGWALRFQQSLYAGYPYAKAQSAAQPRF